MKSCRACCRDFAGRPTDCPWCGFNNATKGGPRSARSLEEKEGERQEQQEFERELEELGNEFAVLLRWAETVEQEQPEGSLT